MPFVIGEVEVTNDVRLAPNSVLYDGAVLPDGDLTIKVNGFNYEIAGNYGKYLGSVCNEVANNATSYVFVDDGGNLWVSTQGFPNSTHIRLARVVTQGGFIVRVLMERAILTAVGSLVSNGAKSGIVGPGVFGGRPLQTRVIFGTPYPDSNYTVALSPVTDGTKSFMPVVVDKTAEGFYINLQTGNAANLVEVGWHTLPIGS
jgi:hypothetical protein